MWMDEPINPADSAGTNWGRHYFGCPICELKESLSDPGEDVFCPTGNILRRRAVAEAMERDRAEHLSEYLTMLADEHADDEYLRSQA